MEPDEWLELVGNRIASRRRELGYRSMRAAAEESPISESNWRQIETGKRTAEGKTYGPRPSTETKALLCGFLGWSEDSIDRLLRGEEPLPAPVTGTVAVVLGPLAATGDADVITERLGRIESLVGELTDRVGEIEDVVRGLLPPPPADPPEL